MWAAGLATGGTLDNAQPGLDFFKQLAAAGNLVPTIAKAGTLASGETPIIITWSYLALTDRDNLKGRMIAQPKREELVQIQLNEQLIVELYSK